MSMIKWTEKITSCASKPNITRVNGFFLNVQTQVELVVQYLLVSDTWTSPVDFVNAACLPAYLTPYQLHDEQGNLLETRLNEVLLKRDIVWGPTAMSNGTQWACRVNCTYGERPSYADGGNGNTERPPTVNDPITIECSTLERTAPLRLDWSSPRRMVVNTVGQPFFDPVTVTYHDRLLRVTRHEYRNPAATQLAFEDAINEYAIWGCDARTLKVNTIEGSWSTDKFGWDVTYSIEHNRYTWDLMPLNQGTKCLQERGSPGVGTYFQGVDWIRDKNGQLVNEPTNLSQDQKVQTEDTTFYATGTIFSTTNTPYYFEDNPFVGYLAADFTLLNFPDLSRIV